MIYNVGTLAAVLVACCITSWFALNVFCSELKCACIHLRNINTVFNSGAPSWSYTIRHNETAQFLDGNNGYSHLQAPDTTITIDTSRTAANDTTKKVADDVYPFAQVLMIILKFDTYTCHVCRYSLVEFIVYNLSLTQAELLVCACFSNMHQLQSYYTSGILTVQQEIDTFIIQESNSGNITATTTTLQYR